MRARSLAHADPIASTLLTVAVLLALGAPALALPSPDGPAGAAPADTRPPPEATPAPDQAFVLNAQLGGATLGIGVNAELRRRRWVFTAGVGAVAIGPASNDGARDDGGAGVSFPISVGYLSVTDDARRHSLELAAGLAPLWLDGDPALIDFVSASYRGEFDVMFVRAGLCLIGVIDRGILPIPFLPIPTVAVGAVF